MDEPVRDYGTIRCAFVVDIPRADIPDGVEPINWAAGQLHQLVYRFRDRDYRAAPVRVDVDAASRLVDEAIAF